MPNHTYQTGDLVERISTGAILPFVRNAGKQIHVLASENENARTMAAWPASDCRPAIDHAERCPHADAEDGTCSHPKNMTPECHTLACPIDSPFAKISEINIDHAAELAAKDAEIARLNATINGLSDDLMTPYMLGVEHGKDAMRGENAKLRKLCGMSLPWPLHDTVAKLVEATKAFLHKHNSDIQGWEEWHCAAQYGEEYAKQLHAAAEGGE